MTQWSWETVGVVVAALAPLAAVPLGVITFYLRGLFENQWNRHVELVRRFELLERQTTELARSVAAFPKDFTTKEEWLREGMFLRGRMERLWECRTDRSTAGNAVQEGK